MLAEPPKIKICGITQLTDAELAVELGAWAIGMVLYERSPRRCSLPQAESIATALRRRVELCGVFVNPSMQEIVEVCERVPLTLLQLHGDEGPAFCSEVARRTGTRVIKALQVSSIGDVRDAERFHTDFHLLDARSRTIGKENLRGGTGETFDWGLLTARRSKTPLILSGGLGPANVVEAIERVRPYAVDSASGTESSPGHKDPVKLRDFFASVGLGSAGSSVEQRPAAPDQRTVEPDQRPAAPDQRTVEPDQRPAAPDQRTVEPDQRPAAPDQRPAAAVVSPSL
jgi:phosphoribosylanthranilate isomerase